MHVDKEIYKEVRNAVEKFIRKKKKHTLRKK